MGSVRCKRWCYSYVKCQYWQYGSGGCWVEIPDSYVTEYPMTIGSGSSRDLHRLLCHYGPQMASRPAPDVALGTPAASP